MLVSAREGVVCDGGLANERSAASWRGARRGGAVGWMEGRSEKSRAASKRGQWPQHGSGEKMS